MRKSAIYVLVCGMVLLWAPSRAHAFVFASNIRTGAGTNNGVLVRGGSIPISYILNEPASSGVTLQILSGTNVIRELSIAAGEAGTLRGKNSIPWDGKNQTGEAVTQGLYSISIKAGAVGYASWTQISQDSIGGNKVFDPYGIAVNQNTNSPYYGRIFVGNAVSDLSKGSNGIFKFNADGSSADEGEFGTGGYPWNGHMTSPWKMKISQNDELFVDDWLTYGTVAKLDQTVSTNTIVLGSSNWILTNSGIPSLSGLAITGSGTNMQIWMCDANNLMETIVPSLGVLRWSTENGGTVSNDCGQVVIAAGDGSDLSSAPFDVDIDRNGAVYVVQRLMDSTDPSYRVMRFTIPADASLPLTNADWKTGPGLPPLTNELGEVLVDSPTNMFDNSYAIAVDSRASNAAVAVRGAFRQNGGLVVLDAQTGAVTAQIDQDYASSYTDVAWDRVGNLYGTQEELWRVFSPPGPNESTTAGAVGIQVLDSLEKPVLSAPTCGDRQIQFRLTGQPSVFYVIETSEDLTNWTAITNSYSPLPERTVQLPPSETQCFFRARADM